MLAQDMVKTKGLIKMKNFGAFDACWMFWSSTIKLIGHCSVKQSDAPDFLVIENNLSYGLEVTQAISSEDARERTEAERSQFGAYFIGDFGGRKPASNLETAAEFTFNIQSAINKKSKKTYVISNQTDLLIYVHGNNGIWLDGNPVDEEGNKYRELVSNYPYQSIDCFRRVILHWNSGRTYFLKDI